MKHLESIADALMREFSIVAPPVPIEGMLQRPRDGMWKELDISQISGSFLRVTDRYSPRMSLARLLVRQLSTSRWGVENGLTEIQRNEKLLYSFARMVVMPACMILEMKEISRTADILSIHFEVPIHEAQLRLEELGQTQAR
jgi:hypothetical protein